VKKTGGVIYVNDTITTGTEKDGTIVGCSACPIFTELRESHRESAVTATPCPAAL
jgi:hypothetical protein